MRARIIWLIAALLIGFIGIGPSHAQEVVNIATNGGFEDGVLTPWWIYGNATGEVVQTLVGAAVPEDVIEGKYCLHIVVPAAGTNFWDAGLGHSVPPFETGKKYTLSAFFKTKSGTLQINFKPELGTSPWTGYGEEMKTITDKWTEYYVTTPVFTANVTPAQFTFHISMTAGDFWVDGVKFYEGDYVPTVIGPRVKAENPNPEDGAVDVPREVVTSWKPGVFADKHDVYFGTVFADVNNASRTNPLGVLASQSQDANTFDPAGLLQFSQTYYWRVDEVNAPPDFTVYKGNVWSFTVEPFAYPIAGANITATASSQFSANQGPGNTINGSGLNAAGLHSTVETGMWLSSMTGPQPTWIQYEFDKVYKLHQMWVWNFNQAIEPVVGLGFKDVTIEYSTDGTNWAVVAGVPQFARAPGTAGYAYNTTVDLSDVVAKYVKITANSNWGGVLPQYGLSEVRFFYVPVVARQPNPASGTKNVSVGTIDAPADVTISWRTGREAAKHNVYLSDSKQAVIAGTASVTTVSQASYGPLSLDLGKIYYWRVDEVNEAETPTTWQGNVWNFSTQEYFVVDDFEDYNDFEPDRIFDTWKDGWGVPANGSQVGYSVPPFAEQNIVHSGEQSMPFDYNNTAGVAYSEAEHTFASPQDWTSKGAKALSLWFRGNPAAFQESPPGTFTMSAAGADIWGASDEFRYAYKQLSGDGSIVAQVLSVQNTDPWAKAGPMIRETLEPGSRFAAVYITPGNGCRFQLRSSTGGSATSDTSVATAEQIAIRAPYWVKLERIGNAFKTYYSRNPATDPWHLMVWSPQTVNMSANAYIGLALTSHQSGVMCVAKFSDVSTTGGVTGAWQMAEIGVAQPANIAAPMYVTLADSANKTATVKHPDSAATNISTWTEWNIDFTQFTGVNPRSIKKMIIGVGDRTNPQPASGRLYIDDIRLGSPIPPVGLVAYYALENNAEDSSANGYHGRVVGSPIYIAGPPGCGMAMQFSGAVGQYVDLGTFNPSEVTDLLSVSLWAKWNGLSGFYQGLIAKRNTWNVNNMMWQIEANVNTGALTFSRQNSYPGSGNPVLPIGEWAHVAVTFDGAIARFYVNGQRTGQGAFSFGLNKDATMHIGCCDANGGNPFNGALDEVRLYDTVLSAAEVLALAGK